MDKAQMIQAFKKLDGHLKTPTRIIIGGGAALIAAYDVPISTQDVDGVPDRTSMELADFKEEVRAVGRDLQISQDWLNDYFGTFLFVLPSNYGDRLVPLFKGRRLEVAALGKEDLHGDFALNFHLPLNLRESSRLYSELSRRGAFSSGKKFPWRYERLGEEELLTLAVLQSRYDPRLLAILVDFFRKERSQLHPVRFKEILRKFEALPLMAVIADFVLESTVTIQVHDFLRFLTTGIKPVPTQLFYRGIYPLGSKKMEEAVTRPPWAFKKWGFLAVDPPLLKEQLHGEQPYLYDETSRLHILKEFSTRTGRFRLRDYRREIGYSVSRQQALKDVAAAGWIRKMGKGKGTFYTIKKPPGP